MLNVVCETQPIHKECIDVVWIDKDGFGHFNFDSYNHW